MEHADILDPRKRVRIKGEELEIRGLTWKDHIRAVKELTATIMELLAQNKDGNATQLDAETIVSAITKQESLATWMITRSTGKDGAWVDSLRAAEALTILNAIVELNLTEEIIGLGKGLAERMSGVFGLSKASLARSTV
jgi:hypothetical protein